MHTSSAMVLLTEHLLQPHSRAARSKRSEPSSLTMNHVLSRRLVLQERFPPSPLCGPPLPFPRSPHIPPLSFTSNVQDPITSRATSGAARWAKTPSPPPDEANTRPPPDGAKTPPPQWGYDARPPLLRC
jgi:hypothetical protein